MDTSPTQPTTPVRRPPLQQLSQSAPAGQRSRVVDSAWETPTKQVRAVSNPATPVRVKEDRLATGTETCHGITLKGVRCSRRRPAAVALGERGDHYDTPYYCQQHSEAATSFFSFKSRKTVYFKGKVSLCIAVTVIRNPDLCNRLHPSVSAAKYPGEAQERDEAEAIEG